MKTDKKRVLADLDKFLNEFREMCNAYMREEVSNVKVLISRKKITELVKLLLENQGDTEGA